MTYQFKKSFGDKLRIVLVIGVGGFLSYSLTENYSKFFSDSEFYNLSSRDYSGLSDFLESISSRTDVTEILIYWCAGSARNNSKKSQCQEDKSRLSKFLSDFSTLKIPTKFIYFSSGGTVYGKGDVCFSETSPLNPGSHYAEMKIECEIELKKYTFNFGWASISYRLANLFGVDSFMKSHRSERSELGLIDLALESTLNNNVISLVVDFNSRKQYGTYRDYALNILLHSQKISLTSSEMSIRNCFSTHDYSIIEIFDNIKRVTNKAVLWNRKSSNDFNIQPDSVLLKSNHEDIRKLVQWESLSDYLKRVA